MKLSKFITVDFCGRFDLLVVNITNYVHYTRLRSRLNALRNFHCEEKCSSVNRLSPNVCENLLLSVVAKSTHRKVENLKPHERNYKTALHDIFLRILLLTVSVEGTSTLRFGSLARYL